MIFALLGLELGFFGFPHLPCSGVNLSDGTAKNKQKFTIIDL